MPHAEVEINAELVKQLLDTQAPQWANEEIFYLATGWDNEVYRLGTELAVRLPRRELGEAIGHNERRWLPQLAAETGLPIALPIFVGEPAPHYPFTFSICPYIPGRSAATVNRTVRDGYAEQFTRILYRLHQPVGASAPRSEFRGVPLAALDEKTRVQISALDAALQEPALALWEDAVSAAPHEGAPVWLHGDPHPHNTIINDSASQDAIVSLVDFGDLCTGDPASDLGMFWMHFSPAVILEAFERYGVEPGSPIWRRSRGWGLRFAMLTANLGPDDLLGAIGREALGILLSDANSAPTGGF